MAPIRRYLRITKYSVLETHIYLDNPALAQTWLLNPRDPVLPRVIESVRPLVLPKVREEKERAQSKKKSKKRSIKDVVVEDDFEVSIFLTETDIRHSLLHKRKLFRDKVQTRLTSNSSKLTGASREAPIDVEGGGQGWGGEDTDVPILREEDDEDQRTINLADIPSINDGDDDDDETAEGLHSANRRPKRRRHGGMIHPRGQGQGEQADRGSDGGGGTDSSADELFVEEEEEEEEGDSDEAAIRQPASKRRREKAATGDTGEAEEGRNDDKKKLAMDISYEGFAIYGRVLCLVVKRRGAATTRGGAGDRGGAPAVISAAGGSKSQTATGSYVRPGGQAMMENWIASTQLPEAAAEDGEAEGL